jgi:hypothetical protein
LSIREVLGYLGYTRDDISQIPHGWGEDADDSLLDSSTFTHNLTTLVALQ